MYPKISVIMASMKEPATIGRALTTLIQDYPGQVEVLLSIPDVETRTAAELAVKSLKNISRLHFSELAMDGKPKGKPAEINHLLEIATGEYWIFGDGDTYFGEGVIQKLVDKIRNENADLVTGRPVSADGKGSLFAYIGGLLADAAHTKRSIELIQKRNGFFPVSGYLYLAKPFHERFSSDTLVDDAYISYALLKRGGRISYEPSAKVFVYYPQNLKDFMKQKKRSVGGYVQLKKYGLVQAKTVSRSLGKELEFLFFPLAYAQNPEQLLWSLLLYPIRLWMWLKIFWEQKIIKKEFFRTWERVESTKGLTKGSK